MKMNKKMLIMMGSVIGIVIVIIIVLMLITGNKSKVISYNEIEERIVNAGQNYYIDHDDQLPSVGTISIDASTLVAEGYLNDISRYTPSDVTCVGKLYVTKNPAAYSYRATLDCGSSYTTQSFKDILMNDLVTEGDGLYEATQIDPNNTNNMQTVYIFKGDNANNYIKVGDYYWQIVKVYENGEIAVLGSPELLRNQWDNRFNIDTQNYRGINEYALSRMHDAILSEVVNDQEGYLFIKSLITTHTACIGKRNIDDTDKDGSAECSNVLTDQYFSLLPVYDYMNASLDANCIKATDDSCYNYNYLANSNEEWWTVTAVGDNTQNVYYVYGTIVYDYGNISKGARLFAHLDPNVSYVSGTGTYTDPYILK